MSFPATRLSVVDRTRSHDEETRRVAWATIFEAYWKPAYKYLRLKWSLDPDQAADLTQEFFTTTLEAVAFAHAYGVVHRDLKPENIMAGGFGEVFVMDWGVAQDGAADAEPAVVGTPGFMPPEQEGAREVDARADVFALGAVLAQLIGERPSPALAAIAAKAQHPDPRARYQTVEQLAADVTRFRNQEPVSAYRESTLERGLRLYRRYELPILLVVAYIVMRFVLLVAVGV